MYPGGSYSSDFDVDFEKKQSVGVWAIPVCGSDHYDDLWTKNYGLVYWYIDCINEIKEVMETIE